MDCVPIYIWDYEQSAGLFCLPPHYILYVYVSLLHICDIIVLSLVWFWIIHQNTDSLWKYCQLITKLCSSRFCRWEYMFDLRTQCENVNSYMSDVNLLKPPIVHIFYHQWPLDRVVIPSVLCLPSVAVIWFTVRQSLPEMNALFFLSNWLCT